MPARPAALCALLLVLSACAGTGGLSLPDVVTSAADSAPGTGLEVENTPVGNPYLDDQRQVSDEVGRRFELATAAMADADWARAMAELEWLMAEYPGLSGPYLNMALLHQAQGQQAQAEHYFKATLAVNERNLEAYNQYAVFLRQQGRFDEAEAVYLAALAVWQDHAATHRNLGVLYDLYRGDRERALEHYHRYQDLTGGGDRAVAGWIVDLERRFGQVVQVAPQ